MLIFDNGTTRIYVTDEPNPKFGGACHEYFVVEATEGADENERILAEIHFQEGPIGERGLNGVQHSDLLQIIQHRLDSFQRGPFASAVNEVTCGFVSAALASENTRTRRRTAAGVEGKNIKATGVET